MKKNFCLAIYWYLKTFKVLKISNFYKSFEIKLYQRIGNYLCCIIAKDFKQCQKRLGKTWFSYLMHIVMKLNILRIAKKYIFSNFKSLITPFFLGLIFYQHGTRKFILKKPWKKSGS